MKAFTQRGNYRGLLSPVGHCFHGLWVLELVEASFGPASEKQHFSDYIKPAIVDYTAVVELSNQKVLILDKAATSFLTLYQLP